MGRFQHRFQLFASIPRIGSFVFFPTTPFSAAVDSSERTKAARALLLAFTKTMAFFSVEFTYRAEKELLHLVGCLSDADGEVYYAFEDVRYFARCSGRGLTLLETDRVCLWSRGRYPSRHWVSRRELIPYLCALETERSWFLYLFFLMGRVVEVRFDRRSQTYVRHVGRDQEGVWYDDFLRDFEKDYGPYEMKRVVELI